MKNSIFKGYAKKILRSEAFISVMIVFVLAIGIIGTSYAIYMDVDTDTNYQLVKVGDLSIGFDNGDNTILLENMTPMEDEYAINDDQSDGKPSLFSFYIYNTGTLTTDYTIKLTTTRENEVDAKYINYQLCKDNGMNCGKALTLGNKDDAIEYSEAASIITATIHNDELAPKKDNEQTNPSAYYFLKIWINKDYVNNSEKEEKIVLKVVVDAKNASGYLDNKNTLSGKILNNTTINNIIPDFKKNETEDKGLYKTEDNNGISYYFRGQSTNNYVNFDNKCWRIISIGGNGTIKLLLQSMTECNENMSMNVIENTSNENSKTTLENWYENSITLKDKTTSVDWCNDISLYESLESISPLTDEEILTKQSERKELYYGSSLRMNSYKPSLKCSNTVNSKIGTLTVDDVMFTGLNMTSPNRETYITKNLNATITLTSLKDKKVVDNQYVTTNYAINNEGNVVENKASDVSSIRPVIALPNDTLASGTGTITDPYIVK